MLDQVLGWFFGDAKAVIAFVALIQPWLIALVRKYWRRGTIDVYPTGTIEAGFSQFGSTVGIQGNLRAIDREFFVSLIGVEVTRNSDQSRRKLEWGAFRPPAAIINPSKEPFEVPAGFMLQPASPRRFNIFFFDTLLQNELRDPLNAFQARWYDARQENNIDGLEAAKEFYEKGFHKDPIVLKTYTAIDRAVYWQKGDYTLELSIHTARPDSVIKTRMQFSLTENDAESLRRNSLNILRAAAFVDDYFFFANAPIKNIEKAS